VIKVHGHTDSQAFKGVTSPDENDRRNLKLSQQRAEAVKKELVARGISKKRIQTCNAISCRATIKDCPYKNRDVS